MTRHPLSLVGAWLVTLSAFVFLFVFALDLFAEHSNPYFGIIFFIIVPVFFVIGLVMIPLGMMLERRRRARGLGPREWPRIDLNNPIHQRTILIAAVLTVVNILIVSLAAFRGVEQMETTEFCGTTCHTVMEPEYIAHRDGPHSRIKCVDCHVGEGAQSFIKYKLNGARMVVALVAGSYSTPIPSPVHNLRPADETCAQCHWPDKFQGDKVRVVNEFASDEANTASTTRLILHVGGGIPELGASPGAHWHTKNAIEFVSTDEKRQEIPYVTLTAGDGTVREFRAPGVTDAQIAAGERRRMDCVDCHNRPTHDFMATPERAVDAALARSAIPPTLPFARRQALEVLKETYADRPTAQEEIAKRLRAFYSGNTPQAPARDVDQLVTATQFLYARSVFPAMNVTWGTHPNNLGHVDAPGCFRCHDDQKKSADGQVIKQDCDLCHEIQ